MPITAKLNIPEETKNISFGRTIIDWDRQCLLFQLSEEKTHIHQLTKPQWNYLVTGLQTLMNQIPNISDIEIPEFNEDITQ